MRGSNQDRMPNNMLPPTPRAGSAVTIPQDLQLDVIRPDVTPEGLVALAEKRKQEKEDAHRSVIRSWLTSVLDGIAQGKMEFDSSFFEPVHTGVSTQPFTFTYVHAHASKTELVRRGFRVELNTGNEHSVQIGTKPPMICVEIPRAR
jgi:hypothetical protein